MSMPSRPQTIVKARECCPRINKQIKICNELRTVLRESLEQTKPMLRTQYKKAHADRLRRQAILNRNIHHLIMNVIANKAYHDGLQLVFDLERHSSRQKTLSLLRLSELIEDNLGQVLQTRSFAMPVPKRAGSWSKTRNKMRLADTPES